jgi:hypothetical protein
MLSWSWWGQTGRALAPCSCRPGCQGQAAHQVTSVGQALALSRLRLRVLPLTGIRGSLSGRLSFFEFNDVLLSPTVTVPVPGQQWLARVQHTLNTSLYCQWRPGHATPRRHGTTVKEIPKVFSIRNQSQQHGFWGGLKRRKDETSALNPWIVWDFFSEFLITISGIQDG